MAFYQLGGEEPPPDAVLGAGMGAGSNVGSGNFLFQEVVEGKRDSLLLRKAIWHLRSEDDPDRPPNESSQWGPLAIWNAMEVIEKRSTFEATRRMVSLVQAYEGFVEVYDSLRMEGTARDIVLLYLLETNGSLYRGVPREERNSVRVTTEYTPWSTWTRRSETFPGTTVEVHHTYSRKRGVPNRCEDFYRLTSPIRLYAQAFASYLNGDRRGCEGGLDETRWQPILPFNELFASRRRIERLQPVLSL